MARSNARPYLLLALLGFLSFGATLTLGFMWDDHEMIEKNAHITAVTWPNIERAFRSDVFDGKGDPYYRPLQTIANMADR